MKQLVLPLFLFTMSGCILEEDNQDQPSPIDVHSSALYGGGSLASLWGSTIPVCFLNAGSGTEALRESFRTITEDNWGRIGNITFTGWGMCPTSPTQGPSGSMVVSFWPGINGGVQIFGYSASAPTDTRVRSDFANDPRNYRYQVLHEVGHALGFMHDQNRPDNFSESNPIFCGNDAFAQHGGVEYTDLPDNSSIMSYCAGPQATQLSPSDVVGFRAAYGSSAHPTNMSRCQYLSDTYGIVANSNWGFAPVSVQSTWNILGCTATPSSPDTCQKISDLYGVDAGISFAFAPLVAQTFWTNHSCGTRPQMLTELCQRASETYGIVPGHSFGTAPSSVRSWWTTNNCSQSPRPQDTCQRLSDHYGLWGITPPSTRGWAPTSARTYWTTHACNTTPRAPTACQQLSDLFGLSPTDSTGVAPPEAQLRWTTLNCSTTPFSPNTCQRASDLYQLTPTDNGFSTAAVRSWFSSHSCTSSYASADSCQVIANRFGIVGGHTFGAAPPEVVSWWTAKGCSARSRDSAPIPG